MGIRCVKCSHLNQPDAENRMRPWCVGCGAGLVDAGVQEQPGAMPVPPAAAQAFSPPSGPIGPAGFLRPQTIYRPRRRTTAEGALAAGVIFLGLGVWSVVSHAENTFYGWSSRNWPKVRGTIVRSWLDEYISTKGGHSFEVRAVYAYKVGGIRYENDKIKFSTQLTGGDRPYGEQELARIAPAGQPRDVYYDPDRPSRSCLIPGVSAYYYTIFPFVTGLFFLIGGTSMWVAVRKFLAAIS